MVCKLSVSFLLNFLLHSEFVLPGKAGMLGNISVFSPSLLNLESRLHETQIFAANVMRCANAINFQYFTTLVANEAKE